MTYSHKLSRRLALLRDLFGLTLMVTLVACNDDPTASSDLPSSPMPAEALQAMPARVIVEVGQTIRLISDGGRGSYRSERAEMSGAPAVEWRVSGGTITQDGEFTANAVGTYKVMRKWQGRKVGHDTTTVVVVPPPAGVVAISVSPDTADLHIGYRRTFTAKALLSDSTWAAVGVTWAATGGQIDAGGTYVAGASPGKFHAIATATSSGKVDTAAIVIDPPTTDSTATSPGDTTKTTIDTVKLSLSPASVTLGGGQVQRFVATGSLTDGTTVPMKPVLVATGGTITADGQFTAGTTPGSYRVIATAAGLADTALVTIAGADCTSTGLRLCPGDNLQAKATAAGSGATLTLQAGIYRLQSIKPLAGQTWVGETGAILSGAKVLTGWQSDGAGHWAVGGQTQENTSYNPNYSCLSGHPGCYLPEQLWVDNALYEHVTSLASLHSGAWYFDYAADRIYLPMDPSGKTVETSAAVYAFGGSASGVTIRNLIVEKYANAAQRAAVNYDGAGSWVIESNEVRQNHGVGIGIAANGVMRNNNVHDQGQLGIKAAGANGLVEGNEIAYNNTAFFGAGHYAETGGSKFVATDGLVVRNNYAHDNHGPGLWTDINNVNCLYEGNRVENNDWRGIFHEISYACVIRNNIVRRNGFRSPGASQFEGAGILISNSSDVQVYGNTVEDNNAGIMAVEADRSADHVSAYGPHVVTNLFVHDNVVRQTDAGRAGGIADWDPNTDPYSAAANNRWSHNTYTVGTSTKWRWTTDLSQAGWRAVPQDSASTWQ